MVEWVYVLGGGGSIPMCSLGGVGVVYRRKGGLRSFIITWGLRGREMCCVECGG